ncbi:DUF1127 domain-containing protein [Bradyrhizobium sp. CSA112]|uniref:DUF1127 domain-containing protein n=1 Tax=Bradyrhizobium sp. CSA112 TaxID=2699170 RepID=UPI0023AF9D4E|nr:DUF1127 domain-containing protein [Bradyrhizobium sp. CSA112]
MRASLAWFYFSGFSPEPEILRRILEPLVMSNYSRQGLALPREPAGMRTFRQQSVSSSSAGGWLRTLEFWIDRSRQRKQLGELAELNDYLLKDIGVSREEALREAEKPFWR